MGMFKYKNLSGHNSAKLVIESHKLASFANAQTFMQIPGAKLLNWASSIGNFAPHKYDINPPKGWRELTPQELGLPQSSLDKHNYYRFDSPVWGKAPINGTGPQAKIFGKFDEAGKVTQVALSVAGTNDLWDIADFFHINNGNIVQPLEPLLNAVRDYSVAKGLTSKDVIVTGFSLGGAMTNLVAKYSDKLSDGFYKDANFLAYASPYIYDNAKMILNIGFENDAVYRYLGNEATLSDSFAATGPLWVNPDKNFESSADNLVLFSKGISSSLFDYKFLSIFNRVNGWGAHGQGARTNAFERIVESKFYEHMQMDSTIIIDQLGALSRWNTWVKDKNYREARSAFIIGNEHNNMLAGGKGGDYLEGNGGNDKFKVGEGADRVDGGTGIDRLVLSGKNGDWDAYHLSDGTLFMHSKNKAGLVQANNVEQVEFSGEILTWTRPYDVKDNVLQDNRFLFRSWNKDKAYGKHIEGTNADDDLSGSVVFAKGGNDKLTAKDSGSLLHGGEGHDILVGGNGNDEIFGAEGNDLIVGSKGADILYGGLGNDTFYFNKASHGISLVKDFNDYTGDKDKLLFSKDLFSSADEAIGAMSQRGENIHIAKYDVAVIIQNAQLSEFDYSNVGII